MSRPITPRLHGPLPLEKSFGYNAMRSYYQNPNHHRNRQALIAMHQRLIGAEKRSHWIVPRSFRKEVAA